ncbi:MAG: alpha/beta fold hydrolase [Solirubrobacterales bacterium]
MGTLVLIHGSNHGGWCWERVVPLLEGAGHEVFAPSLPGMAERAGELTPEAGLSTHVDDVVELLDGEDLQDVTLVGHSYAGAVITGVAELRPERIARLVYLDAFTPGDGESVMDMEPPASREAFERVVREQGDGWRVVAQEEYLERWGLTDPDDREWVWARLTDQPFLSCTEKVSAPGNVARQLPRTFIALTRPRNAGLAPSTERARSEGFEMLEIATGHDAMVTEPARLAEMLSEIASR